MSYRSFAVLVIVLGVVASGCYTHRYATSPEAIEGDEVYRQWHHHWLFGLISKDEVDLSKVCDSGNYYIEDKHTFVNQLLGALTFGIWYPTTVTVLCADGSAAAEIPVDEETARAIFTAPMFLELVADVAPERLAAARTAQGLLEAEADLASE